MDTNKTRAVTLAGFDAQVVDASAGAAARAPVVVLLHGFSMRAGDLSPFGASMGLPGVFVFPEGPIALGPVAGDVAPGRPDGRAWWMIDVARRAAQMARGDERDLSDERPPGLAGAREGLGRLVAHVVDRWPGRPLFLGGFSQGAILSLDLVARTALRPAGLVLLSGARVDTEELAPYLGGLRGLPVFQSHGTGDRELAFSAAERLRNDLVSAGAVHKWCPFDGGHEIPLIVLRELKRFLRSNVT